MDTMFSNEILQLRRLLPPLPIVVFASRRKAKLQELLDSKWTDGSGRHGGLILFFVWNKLFCLLAAQCKIAAEIAQTILCAILSCSELS